MWSDGLLGESIVAAGRIPYRVCVTGVECTGKTTLCAQLGAHYDSPVVPEAGREYFAEKLARGDATVFTGDLMRVIHEQAAREDASLLSKTDVVLWDTDVMTVAMWHDIYTIDPIPEILDFVAQRREQGLGPDLYLLCVPDFKFVPDSVRTGGPVRLAKHDEYASMLETTGIPVATLFGSPAERLAMATSAIDAALFARHD